MTRDDAPFPHSEIDFAIIGAGPAGIAAASVAAEHGLQVSVFDQGDLPGGQIWRGRALHGAGANWRLRFFQSGAKYYARTAVVDLQADGTTATLTVERATDAAVVRAKAVLLATGARELLLPFPGWTLPGVMGAGGAQALLKSGLDVAGKRVLVAGTGPLILAVAAALRDAGANVLRVLEQAPLSKVVAFSTALWRSPYTLSQAIDLAPRTGARYRTSAWITAAHGANRLEAVTIRDARGQHRFDCDMLCVGMGLIPSTELARLVGCEMDPATAGVKTDDAQRTSIPNLFAAGETVGIGGMEAAILQGATVGLTVAGREVTPTLRKRRARLAVIARQMRESFALRDELRALVTPDTIVCRCEDVSYADITHCDSIRAAKLYTRCGMGPCQGRICGAALGFLRGWESDTIRQPVQPARVSTLISPI